MSNKQLSPFFIIGSRHLGLTLLTSIKTYSTILQKEILGEISDAHRKALKVIFDCCETPWENWKTLTKLIEQNESETALELLLQIDVSGQSFLERNFIHKSLTSMEVAKKTSTSILKQAQQLTDEQKHYMEIIDKDCQREIKVWKEISSYFS